MPKHTQSRVCFSVNHTAQVIQIILEAQDSVNCCARETSPQRTSDF